MTIIKLLTKKDATAEDTLEAVADIVAGAREAYGNAKVKIADPKIETTHGLLAFSHIENDAKVEVLKNQALRMKSIAVEYVENNPGSVLNKKVEELLATNPFFVNVSTESEFAYL